MYDQYKGVYQGQQFAKECYCLLGATLFPRYTVAVQSHMLNEVFWVF